MMQFICDVCGHKIKSNEPVGAYFTDIGNLRDPMAAAKAVHICQDCLRKQYPAMKQPGAAKAHSTIEDKVMDLRYLGWSIATIARELKIDTRQVVTIINKRRA